MKKWKPSNDRLQHYMAGMQFAIWAMLMAILYHYMWTVMRPGKDFNWNVIAFWTTLTPLVMGLTKEIGDSQEEGNKFDVVDMLWTWAGGATVFVPLSIFTLLI